MRRHTVIARDDERPNTTYENTLKIREQLLALTVISPHFKVYVTTQYTDAYTSVFRAIHDLTDDDTNSLWTHTRSMQYEICVGIHTPTNVWSRLFLNIIGVVPRFRDILWTWIPKLTPDYNSRAEDELSAFMNEWPASTFDTVLRSTFTLPLTPPDITQHSYEHNSDHDTQEMGFYTPRRDTPFQGESESSRRVPSDPRTPSKKRVRFHVNPSHLDPNPNPVGTPDSRTAMTTPPPPPHT